MKIWHKGLLATALGIGLYGGVYVYSLHSDGYKFIKRTLENSPNIKQMAGSDAKVNLSLFGTFKEKHVNSDETVITNVDVSGNRRSFTVSVNADRRNGVWKIETASSDGVPILLE